jgi:hypothetical protein
MSTENRRAFVRCQISFKVNFWIIEAAKDDRPEEVDGEKISPPEDSLPPEPGKIIEYRTDRIDHSLISFILRLDEKLDLIIHALAGDQQLGHPYFQAAGECISGSGIRMVTDIPLVVGQVLHLSFALFKEVFLFVDVQGVVSRVKEKPAGGRHEVGIEFINLKPDDKEKIIAIIFRQNREMIRELRQETT